MWTDFGKLQKTSRVDQNGTPVSAVLYEYNDGQQLVKSTNLKADGSVDFYYTHEYDADGKKIREMRYNAKNELVGTTEY